MDRPTFVHHLRRSKLLSDEVINQSVVTLPEQDGQALAERLVADRVLTRYQARQILQGHSRGFVLGPYRILDQLGSGGMGTVFKALHTPMNRLVAIKILPAKGDRDPFDLELFQREVRAAARLHHPHIVTAYDASETAGVFYMAMEYVNGPSMDRLVAKHGPLPVSLVCLLFRQAAEGLAYAHAQGMVHRDIKPANLLVGGLGKGAASAGTPFVKILDFGLARIQEDGAGQDGNTTIAVKAGTVFGTPDYISPEQAQDIHSVDHRSDIYSLGCAMYFALAGRPPFAGDNSIEKLVKHLTAEPEPLESVRPEVPAAVAAVVRRCMAKSPGDRFASAQEVAEALRPHCQPSTASAAQIETLAELSLKTPSGSDADMGTGWDLEGVPSRPLISLPGGDRRPLVAFLSTLAGRLRSAIRCWRFWVWAGAAVGAGLATLGLFALLQRG